MDSCECLYEPHTLVWLSPDEIKPTPWNPPVRTNPDSVRSVKLKNRIRNHGFQRPINIDEAGVLIDGNRRLLAAQGLIEEGRYRSGNDNLIPCYVSKTCLTDADEPSAEVLYASFNDPESVWAIAGNQVLTIYMEKPESVPPKSKEILKGLEMALGGNKELQSLVDKGLSFSLLKFAEATRKNLSDDTLTLKQITHWLIKHKMAARVREAKRWEVPKTTITSRIKADIPIGKNEITKYMLAA